VEKAIINKNKFAKNHSMYRRCFFVFLFFAAAFRLSGQKQDAGMPGLKRPKLVVGIVVDQMRWDFLYRFYNRYGTGGFRRLMHEGYSCEHTMIDYLPSYTAVGHSCIFTGSVPSLNGITGNDWMDQVTGQVVYCTGDSEVQGVGSESEEGRMSPRNLLVTTITDELRVATQFQSKVVGISLKDRAAILPAGHAANAAFWLDDANGYFITSTYYMKDLPDWVRKFNNENRIDKLISNDWTTLYPLSTYTSSDSDYQSYEGKFPGEAAPVFPHHLKGVVQKNRGYFRATPFGNSLTLEFAAAAIDGYQMGKDSVTDFLTINCASTDYVGHMFGPNSIEIEDTYLRLDQDLAKFFSLLDEKIGKGQYLIFLTADHGVANAIGFMKNHQLPADFFSSGLVLGNLNKLLLQKFGTDKLVLSAVNFQINFDERKIAEKKLDFEAIRQSAAEFLSHQPGINYAVDINKIGVAPIPEPIRTMIINGYNLRRSGPVQIVLKSGWIEGFATGTTHGSWNPYDTHVPLLFMGWGIHHGTTAENIHMTDIAPTLAALLHIQMPSGCIGKPIHSLLQ
jgi:predicted AlkP superfamily pyrophosphatase or phosphodiesterase